MNLEMLVGAINNCYHPWELKFSFLQLTKQANEVAITLIFLLFLLGIWDLNTVLTPKCFLGISVFRLSQTYSLQNN